MGEGGILAVPASLLFLSLNICGRNPGTGMNLKLVSFLLDYFYFFKAQVDPLLWFVKYMVEGETMLFCSGALEPSDSAFSMANLKFGRGQKDREDTF